MELIGFFLIISIIAVLVALIWITTFLVKKIRGRRNKNL